MRSSTAMTCSVSRAALVQPTCTAAGRVQQRQQLSNNPRLVRSSCVPPGAQRVNFIKEHDRGVSLSGISLCCFKSLAQLSL